MENWIPVLGEVIHIGVPSISLVEGVFIAITSDGKYLYWNSDKTKAEVVSPEFCYQIRGGR